MRNFFSLLSLIFLSGTTFAQNSQQRVDSLRKLLGKQITSLQIQEQRFRDGQIPPNAYNLLDKRRTVNLSNGEIETYKLHKIDQDIKAGKYELKTPLKFYENAVSENGKAISTPWIERGPYSVGGRTRAIMFDPNDTTGKRVFAGGVSGGLWKIEDITSTTAEWTPINDFWANTSISCIAYDPNNTQIFYVGTGESMTNDAIGAGVWKTSDGGTTWTQIFNPAVTYTVNGRRNGIFYVNDIKVRNNNGVSEVYVGTSGGSVDGTLSGYYDTGLYKSTNGGATFTRDNYFFLTTSTSTGLPIHHSIQQIEIAADNAIWVSTRRSGFSDATTNSGGKIFRSANGTSWSLVYNANLPNSRVQIALSKSNGQKAYALMQGNGTAEPVRILKTTNGGTSWVRTGVTGSGLTLPDDVDTGIPANDFTRGQSFYDLVIVTDPDNDENVYAGGIDLFKSTNGGGTWSQISKWSNNNNLAALNVPLIHADQHAIVFNPKNTSQMLFGHDGGITYAANKSSFVGSAAASTRNTRYNVTQFYDGKLNPLSVVSNEEMLAGAQDNGTRRFTGAPLANNFYNNSSFYGGDGGWVEFDDNNAYKIGSYVYNSHFIYYNSNPGYTDLIQDPTNQGKGNFINEFALDRNLDVFYSNANDLNIFQVTNLASGVPSAETTINVGIPQTNDAGQAIETISFMKVSPYTTTSSTLFVGTNLGRLFKVSQAQSTAPSSLEIITPVVGNISWIEFGSNENEILLTVSNYGQNSIKVYYTMNGGTSWLEKQGNLPDMPVRTAWINPDNRNEVIIGTETGIWQTANFSATVPTWSKSPGNIGTVRVSSLDYRPATKTLMAATYGRGVYTVQNSTLATVEGGVNTDQFTLYPNPSRGNLKLKMPAKFRNLDITMYDASGKLVFKKEKVGSEEEFFTNLTKGVYMITASNGTEKVFSSKVIIK